MSKRRSDPPVPNSDKDKDWAKKWLDKALKSKKKDTMISQLQMNEADLLSKRFRYLKDNGQLTADYSNIKSLVDAHKVQWYMSCFENIFKCFLISNLFLISQKQMLQEANAASASASQAETQPREKLMIRIAQMVMVRM